MSKVATDLLSLRIARGYSNRTEFARACGVDRVTVWRWETGRRGLSAEMCRKVAEVLDLDMETVLEAVEGDE